MWLTSETKEDLKEHKEEVKDTVLQESLEQLPEEQRLASYLPDNLAHHELTPRFETVWLEYTERLFPWLEFKQRYNIATAISLQLLRWTATEKETSSSFLEWMMKMIWDKKDRSWMDMLSSLTWLLPHFSYIQELLSQAWNLSEARQKDDFDKEILNNPLSIISYFEGKESDWENKKSNLKEKKEEIKAQLVKIEINEETTAEETTATLSWLLDTAGTLASTSAIIQPTAQASSSVMTSLLGLPGAKLLLWMFPAWKNPLKIAAWWLWVDDWVDPLCKMAWLPAWLDSFGWVLTKEVWKELESSDYEEVHINTQLASNYEIINENKTFQYMEDLKDLQWNQYRKWKTIEEKTLFLNRVSNIASKNGMDANHLLLVLLSESNIQPTANNRWIACGIFQLTAIGLKDLTWTGLSSHKDILKKNPMEQLDILDIFLARIYKQGAKYPSVEAVYTALFAPKYLYWWKEVVADTILYTKTKNPDAYEKNPLDHNNDGNITAGETAHRLKKSIMKNWPWFAPKWN